MAALTVRNLEDDLVRALKRRAVEEGVSAEELHRRILRRGPVSARRRARGRPAHPHPPPARRRGSSGPDQRDLAAAMLAARFPGAMPYHGPIDLALLEQTLAPLHFDAAALTWLAGLASAATTRPTGRSRVAAACAEYLYSLSLIHI